MCDAEEVGLGKGEREKGGQGNGKSGTEPTVSWFWSPDS